MIRWSKFSRRLPPGPTVSTDHLPSLHPRGDVLPYMLGHLIVVPAETGASYGDLDEQYLTASYRVYLSEADAKKVFSYVKHLQATSPVWNAETVNCVFFIGRIASFMGLKTPIHLLTGA